MTRDALDALPEILDHVRAIERFGFHVILAPGPERAPAPRTPRDRRGRISTAQGERRLEDVRRLDLEGLSGDEIAQQLEMSRRTVSRYRARMREENGQ